MDPNLDAKQRYTELKKRLRHLIAENEVYKQEIIKVNERLLKVGKDKTFLLEQLLQFEDNDSSTESDLSESDHDLRKPEPPKKKPRQRKPKSVPANSQHNQTKNHNPKSQGASLVPPVAGHQGNSKNLFSNRAKAGSGSQKRRSRIDSSVPSNAMPATVNETKSHQVTECTSQTSRGSTLTSEEVERHLLAKQSPRIQMPPQPTSLTLPAELFNEDAFLSDFAAEQIV